MIVKKDKERVDIEDYAKIRSYICDIYQDYTFRKYTGGGPTVGTIAVPTYFNLKENMSDEEKLKEKARALERRVESVLYYIGKDLK
jgi:hypothetical protein